MSVGQKHCMADRAFEAYMLCFYRTIHDTRGMDAVADIKSRLDIEDVVSEYVQLKRAGRNFKGLSPWTNEKSPSFVVSPEKQIWHDFSSGRGGDMFSFIQEVEGLDFKGSLEVLARKAGVDLEQYRTGTRDQAPNSSGSKKRLYEAVEAAVKFYQVQLTRTTPPLEYVRKKRGYSKQTILDFRFGYAPESGKALLKHLTSKGYDADELKQAGLVSSRGSDVYDMFRGRVMIPLRDGQGRPVGFTARKLSDTAHGPKYINTPATQLYDKGRQVFGFYLAKEAIRKQGFAVVVEGNLDVVASHQAGVCNVVASAGTALTSHHLKSLKRFTGDIRVAFDDDRAGHDAAKRAIPLAQSLGGIDMSIISVPEGKDPDELIAQDARLWQAVVENPQYMVDWLIDRVAGSVDMKSAQGKRRFVAEIIPILKQLSDPVEQEHYADVLATRTSTSIQTITDKINAKQTTQKRLKRVAPQKQDEQQSAKEQRVREQHILALGSKHSVIGEMVRRIPVDVFSEGAQTAARLIADHPGVTPSLDNKEYGTMLALLYEEFYQHTDEHELRYQAHRLISRLVRVYAKTKKSALAQELAEATENEQGILLQAVKQLDDLIVQFSSSEKTH